MADILQLHQPEPMVWICDCGCSTFEMLSDGTARCVACEADHEGIGSGWLDRNEGSKSRHDEGDTFRDVDGNGSTEFARRRITGMAQDNNAVTLVVVRKDGSVSTWSAAETPEQMQWTREKLAHAVALITSKVEG